MKQTPDNLQSLVYNWFASRMLISEGLEQTLWTPIGPNTSKSRENIPSADKTRHTKMPVTTGKLIMTQLLSKWLFVQCHFGLRTKRILRLRK